MKRILIVANTYYQLIMAMQMKTTIFAFDDVVLFLSDRSKNADDVADKLCRINLFEKVHFIKTKCLTKKKNIFEKAGNFFENIVTDKNRYKSYFEGIEDLYFDEMVSFNIDIMTYNFYSILYEHNTEIQLSGYEEGIPSYNAQNLSFPGSNLICIARNFFGKKSIDQAYAQFYCFFPSLYRGEFKTVEVPRITKDSNIIEALRYIFDVKSSDLDYHQKYIYFASVYDFEGGAPIGEFDLVCKIADMVGRDNLIVKIHPRDTRDVYKSNNIKVITGSYIPWEAIQLLGDFSGKTYLTATSNSILAGCFLSSKPIRSYYLYRLCNISNNLSARTSTNNIESLLSQESMQGLCFDSVHIANSLEDII